MKPTKKLEATIQGIKSRPGTVAESDRLGRGAVWDLLRLHLISFFGDFKSGARNYFETLRQLPNSELRKAFENAFDNFFVELVKGYR